MKMHRLIVAVFFLNLFFGTVRAQETEFPLSGNPVIKEYLRTHPVSQNANTSLRGGLRTVSLPFEDDFSTPSVYPNTQLWMDSDAFVNETYSENPVTVGMVTLDGINKLGEPHDSGSQSSTPVICDYLTSRPIDLSVVTAADSVYLSFYF